MQNNIIKNIEESNLDTHLPKQEGRSKRSENYERVVRGKTQDSGTRGTQYTRPGSDFRSETIEYNKIQEKKQGDKDIEEGKKEYHQEQNANPNDYGKVYDDEEPNFNFTLENYKLHREQQDDQISSFKIGNNEYLFQDYTDEEIESILDADEKLTNLEKMDLKAQILEDYFRYKGIPNNTNTTDEEKEEIRDADKQKFFGRDR